MPCIEAGKKSFRKTASRSSARLSPFFRKTVYCFPQDCLLFSARLLPVFRKGGFAFLRDLSCSCFLYGTGKDGFCAVCPACIVVPFSMLSGAQPFASGRIVPPERAFRCQALRRDRPDAHVSSVAGRFSCSRQRSENGGKYFRRLHVLTAFGRCAHSCGLKVAASSSAAVMQNCPLSPL